MIELMQMRLYKILRSRLSHRVALQAAAIAAETKRRDPRSWRVVELRFMVARGLSLTDAREIHRVLNDRVL